MNVSDIKFDCRHFRGDVPCLPNKLRNKQCADCDEYDPVGPRILVIKLGAIGDVVRTTPLVYRFRQDMPEAHITWITLSPEVVPRSLVDRVLPFDFVSTYVLRHESFDLAVNLDKDLEACALLTDVQAKQKFGFILQQGHVAPATPAASHKLLTGMFDGLSKQNTKHYMEEIFEICGLHFRNEPYVLDLNAGDESEWEALQQEAAGRKIVGLNTGCGPRWLTRLWPEAYWLELIERLQQAGHFPLLLGGPYEHEKNLSLAQQSQARYLGTFPLPKFMSLVHQCDVLVSAVTLAMHLAIGLGVPLVLFNNIFNPNEYYLYNNGILLQPQTGCDCYYGNTCSRQRHCMWDLPVDMVFDAIETLLKKRK